MSPVLQAIFTIADQTKQHMPFALSTMAIYWIAFAFTVVSGYTLLNLGIRPRKLIGLIGIIFSPFLHAGFNHIFFNSIPLFILSCFMLLGGVGFYLNASIYLILLSGLFTWVIGRPRIHVGASSLITAYWGFLMINALLTGGVMAYLLGFVCAYYFAGIFFGIFPKEKGVSWEGHFSGMVAGILLFYSYSYLPMLVPEKFITAIEAPADTQDDVAMD